VIDEKKTVNLWPGMAQRNNEEGGRFRREGLSPGFERSRPLRPHVNVKQAEDPHSLSEECKAVHRDGKRPGLGAIVMNRGIEGRLKKVMDLR